MKGPVKRTRNYYYFCVLINPSGNCKKRHKKWHSFSSPSWTDLRHFGGAVVESFGLDPQEALGHTNPAFMCYSFLIHSTQHQTLTVLVLLFLPVNPWSPDTSQNCWSPDPSEQLCTSFLPLHGGIHITLYQQLLIQPVLYKSTNGSSRLTLHIE